MRGVCFVYCSTYICSKGMYHCCDVVASLTCGRWAAVSMRWQR